MLPLHIKTLAHKASVVLADARRRFLCVQGLLVDEVIWVAPILQLSDKPDTGPLLKNPEAILEIWNAFSAQTHSKIEATVLFTALVHTLTAGMDAEYQSTVMISKKQIADFLAFMLATLEPMTSNQHTSATLDGFVDLLRRRKDPSSRDPDRHFLAMNLMASSHLVFITKKGHIGLGHSQVLAGNVVAMLYGSKLPCILRPRKGFWRFVGEC
jgi:hypothetical protein